MISMNTYEKTTQMPIFANAKGANPRPVPYQHPSQSPSDAGAMVRLARRQLRAAASSSRQAWLAHRL